MSMGQQWVTGNMPNQILTGGEGAEINLVIIKDLREK
jgi:hypothetical protein